MGSKWTASAFMSFKKTLHRGTFGSGYSHRSTLIDLKHIWILILWNLLHSCYVFILWVNRDSDWNCDLDFANPGLSRGCFSGHPCVDLALCKIYIYSCTRSPGFLSISTITSHPGPASEKPLHSMMLLPPPGFMMGMVCFWCLAYTNTQNLVWWPKAHPLCHYSIFCWFLTEKNLNSIHCSLVMQNSKT